jgi:DNA-binding NarL/FixJ family response regulator
MVAVNGTISRASTLLLAPRGNVIGMTTILLVDHSQVDRRLAARRLESKSTWSVVPASSPEQGLEILGHLPCDLLIVSPAHCFEGATILIRRARDIDPEFPVVILSDRADETSGIARLCLHAQAYVCKHEINEVLVEEVEAVLRQQRERRLELNLWKRRISHKQEFAIENDTKYVPVLVGQLIDAVGASCGDSAARMKMSIALEEALLNAMIHGNLEVSSELRQREDDAFQKLVLARQRNPIYADRKVTVGVDVGSDRVEFSIADEGPGFDVDALPDPTREDRVHIPSGRGIMMMRTLMDEVRFNAQGNQVTLTMWLTPRGVVHAERRSPAIAEVELSTVPA